MVLLITNAILYWLLLSGAVGFGYGFSPQRTSLIQHLHSQVMMVVEPEVPEEVEVIVIGSILAGLSCTALLSHCDKPMVVLEPHDIPGGAHHSWTWQGFHFKSGPSLQFGLRPRTCYLSDM
jgi:hypothetical protein